MSSKVIRHDVKIDKTDSYVVAKFLKIHFSKFPIFKNNTLCGWSAT
jgi:hypothetical protein